MITIERKRVLKFFVILAVLLIIMHSAIAVVYYIVGDPEKFDFIRMFDLDREQNIPTLFSSLLFIFNALLFWLIGKNSADSERKYWYGLAGVFAFLSFDESATIHENLGDLTEQFVDASGILYYPWVISYSLLVLMLVVFYFRFFYNMPKKLFYRFVLAAAIFLSGAIGFELLGAQEADLYGTDSPLYTIYYTIEESLEMFGLIYLMGILLDMLDGKQVLFSSSRR